MNLLSRIVVSGAILTLAVMSVPSHGQQQMTNLKVKSPIRGHFDAESQANLRVLHDVANTSGRLIVWVVLDIPYDVNLESDAASSERQQARVVRLRDKIVKRHRLDVATVDSPTIGPYFTVTVNADELIPLARDKAVKGYWGIF